MIVNNGHNTVFPFSRIFFYINSDQEREKKNLIQYFSKKKANLLSKI